MGNLCAPPEPEELFEFEKTKTWDDHKISQEALAARFETDLENGLTSEQAEKKFAEYGENLLSKNGRK